VTVVLGMMIGGLFLIQSTNVTRSPTTTVPSSGHLSAPTSIAFHTLLREDLSQAYYLPPRALPYMLGNPASGSFFTQISDQQTWSTFWQQTYCSQYYCPSIPDVDFNTRTVLVVAFSYGGAANLVSVTNVSEFADHLLVQATLTTEGLNCIYPAIILYPTHLVDIPKTELPLALNVTEVPAPSC